MTGRALAACLITPSLSTSLGGKGFPPGSRQNYTSDPATASRNIRGRLELPRLRRASFFRDDPDLVVQHLHEAAAHVELACGAAAEA